MRTSALLCLAFLASFGAASLNDLSPISRCVKLLQDLGKQIEQDAKKEEDLYESFICWGKKVVDTKTASNSAAESRIDMLKQYLADIDAGRVEFTSERQDIEKEIEELRGDLEVAKTQRDQENKDFQMAEAEMKKAVNALTSAVDVLEKATKPKTKKSALVALRTRANLGFAERAAEGATLSYASTLGEKFLTKGDAVFLRRLLTGEVPSYEWKKLNRKATFKMTYEARSTKIQSILKKLLSTFQANLKSATDKEADAKKSYDTLKGTKSGQLDAAEKALAKMESEMGARGMSKADAEKEVSDLETQVKNDKKFIEDTQKSMATKKTEWKERSQLRAGELKAISEAVAILSSDDARDNFKKSMASQGFLFLQTESQGTVMSRVNRQIQDLARVTDDNRLLGLVQHMVGAPKDQIKPVITAIDKMVQMLKDDEKKDLSTKEDCEKTRMGDTRDLVEAGREIDDNTDAINSLNSEITDLNKELDETKAELKAATEEINAAKKQRAAENAEWKVSDAEDKEASDTVASAHGVLEKFYKDSGLMSLAQQPAGEAPPPPPTTWDGDYKGKTGEATGILGILKLVQEDIDKDRSDAKAAEDAAQADYDKAFKAFQEQEKALKKTIGSLEGQIGEREKKVEDTTKSRATKKGELDVTLKKIKNAEPGCDYMMVNYPMRVKNRQIEIDGLLKAKAILQGATFDKPADPSREIKPGDALLQRARRH